MKRVTAWMLVAGVLTGLVAGCEQKTEEAVAQAPTQDDKLLPLFPENQVPDPDPQPVTESASPRADGPPVDVTATAADSTPVTTARPLPKESYAPTQPKATRTYVVKKGDTLQNISRKFYKTSKKWRAIYNANRDVLAKGPDHLQVGMKLKIP